MRTARLSLRLLREDDFSALCHVLQDIDVMYAWEHAFSDEQVRGWIAENRMRYERDGHSYWAAETLETGELAGVCGLLRETAGDREVIGVGYIFAKAFWHGGYATEAAEGCAAYARQLGIKELTSQIRPENTASRRVAERLGMQVAGTFIKTYQGKQMPHLLYVKTL